MGSQIDEPAEVTVLVTGFLPFREKYPVNPSWEIARSLPSHLPAQRAKDPSSRHGVNERPVRILVHPEAIRVNYNVARALVPSFWEAYQGHNVDYVIHVGMAGEHPHYQIERRGHRSGYTAMDVDGQLPDRDREERGSDWVWYGLPDEIENELDMPDVLSRWQAHSPEDLDLRLSDDAGRYLCDFIYFSSLAYLWKQQRTRKVVFLHVPADASDTAVTRGRELMLTLIRSIVESEASRASRESLRQKKLESQTPGDGDL